ncbi:MAG: aspartate--tRNA(Asn) ligase [Clostridia bacterium]|nr:aspartate--tRNA(Asn) ligase [Clostridia bacterium]MBR3487671.1 aspartate--tRNA(Asn) ligase [Clostridia bacterium]
MERILTANAPAGEYVRVGGFVENLRNKRYMAFIVLRDMSGKLQLTVDKGAFPEVAEEVDKLTIESVVTAYGKIVENPAVKMGGREMVVEKLVVESVAGPMPLMADSAIDSRLDYRWIDLRTEKNKLMIKAQTELVRSFRDFLLERNFVEIHTPKIIGAASESGADVFELTYFDRKAYLAQSPQFYKQMAMAAGLERIFEVGPVFRAEKSFTSRHATEFTGFDLEFSYIDSYEDVMHIEEELLTYALKNVAEKYGEEIERLYGLKTIVPALPFPRIKLHDLYDELEKRYGYTVPEEEKVDLSTDAEKLSFKFAQEVYGHEFLFVTDFPKDKRAFYHMRKDGVPQGYDLIWRGTEITTGAQREHRYEILKQQADEKGLGEDVKFYMEFFRYGCPPHGGFGLGVDRMTMLLLDIGIKEAEFIFRSPIRLNP